MRAWTSRLTTDMPRQPPLVMPKRLLLGVRSGAAHDLHRRHVAGGLVFLSGHCGPARRRPAERAGADLGLWALRFLILCLAITPLRRLGGPNLIRYRRAVGLLAFYYALLHLTVYMVLDQGLDLAAIWADIVKRPYITVGMARVPRSWCRWRSPPTRHDPPPRRPAWQRLHRLVYVAAVAAAVHFIMLVKVWAARAADLCGDRG